MFAKISKERKAYYTILEKTQKENLDITAWLLWFLECLKNSLLTTDELLSNILLKAEFWEYHRKTTLNDRKRLMINKLWDDFFGKLTTSKWAKMTKYSPEAALRDVQDLIKKQILQKEGAGGGSTTYVLVLPKLLN